MQLAGRATTLASYSTAALDVCGFLAEIKFAESAPETGRFGGTRYTPSPSVYWNHRVSVKMRFDLWGSITYRQNLDAKELTDRNFEYEGPKRDGSTSAHRPGLGILVRLRWWAQGQMSH